MVSETDGTDSLRQAFGVELRDLAETIFFKPAPNLMATTPNSFLLLVAMPGAPGSVFTPSSKASSFLFLISPLLPVFLIK